MQARTQSPPINTERLILRRWRDSDREPFAAMCADPAAMEFLPKRLTRQECDAYIDALRAHQAAHGFCFWALEDRATGAFAGYTGLRRTGFDAHFTPAVEFGWRLPVAFWGRGFASEAARACLDYGFGPLEPFPLRLNRSGALALCFVAFSRREPASTSLENALKLHEIVAIAAPRNARSRAVMRRLGMSYDPAEDFIHPLMAADHPLQPCTLYRIGASGHRPSGATSM